MNINKTIKYFLNKVGNIEKSLKYKINNLSVSNNETSVYWQKMQREIISDYEKLRKISNYYLNKIVGSSYMQSLEKNITRIKNLSFKGNKNIDLKTLYNNFSTRRTIKNLIINTTQSLAIGIETGKKSLLRTINATQQSVLKENKINKLINDELIKSNSVYNATKKLRNELTQQAIDGKLIKILDKNGKERNYNIKDYSEMVTRTKVIEAENTATINTAIEVGSDLVQMSSHNTKCPICAPIEGKVYSISGKDQDFPALDFSIPLHPNCEHSLTVIFKETLEHRGIDRYIDFANNKTEEHPTMAKHIPVSKRDLL